MSFFINELYFSCSAHSGGGGGRRTYGVGGGREHVCSQVGGALLVLQHQRVVEGGGLWGVSVGVSVIVRVSVNVNVSTSAS